MFSFPWCYQGKIIHFAYIEKWLVVGHVVWQHHELIQMISIILSI